MRNVTVESASPNVNYNVRATEHEETIEMVDANYRMTSFIIAWFILALCVIGIMGNIISLIIYCKASMISPINVLLAGLSLIDLFLSIFSIPTFVIPGFYAYYGTPALRALMSYSAVYVYPLTLIMQTASVWTFVVITIERWQTVCRPRRKFCLWFLCRKSSIRRSRLILIIVCLLAAIYNVVRFFEFELKYSTDNQNSTDKPYQYVEVEAVLRNSTVHPIYMNVYYIGLFLITHFIIPFSLLVILNGLIVVTIWRSRKRRQSLNRKERKEHRTAIMMIIVVITFIVCYTLLFILNIVEAVDPEWFYRVHNLVLAFALNDISNALIIINAAFTIFVYSVFSEKYRFTLTSLFLSAKQGATTLARRRSTTYDDTTSTRKFSLQAYALTAIRSENLGHGGRRQSFFAVPM